MYSFRCIAFPKKTLASIIDSGNSYLIQAKGNQPKLLTDIKEVTSSVASLQKIWKDLRTYIKVERLCEENGYISLKTSFFVSNLTTTENNAFFFTKEYENIGV